jgi:hypothetical protein
VNRFVTLISVLALLAGAVLTSGTVWASDQVKEKSPKSVFVDLDGDGFDDNATVNEAPPALEMPKADAAVASADSTNVGPAMSGGFFDFDRSLIPQKQVFLNYSSAFAFNKQRVPCMLGNRGGFGSGNDFGSSGDTGVGNVIGGCCVGGVCH